MRPPLLGNQTFLRDHTVPALAYSKAMNERYVSGTTGLAIPANDKPLYTGRYIVILNEESQNFARTNSILEAKAGFRIASIQDFSPERYSEAALTDADAITYNQLGIALISGDDDQIAAVSAYSDDQYIVIPERVAYVPDDIPSMDNQASTWGLVTTNVINSAYSGKGVKVAILDTGLALKHPDFFGRSIVSKSFIAGELDAEDGHGHGTHCVGVACGFKDMNGVRYGVANESEIYIGKVLNRDGSGAQEHIWNGMLWAADSGCKVISMSIESAVFPGQGFDLTYERFAKYAVSKGAVVVAAAGNRSRRSLGYFNPVGSPADSPSVLAVAALDNNLNVADFSNRGINLNGQIDIAGPGVDIYSTWCMPQRYKKISGTSMAAPHVAGIIALLWEKNPGYAPNDITLELLKFTKKLPVPSMDIGSGLVMAP